MSWWIVTTGPSLERRAIVGLTDAGFEAWTPMRLVTFKTRHMLKSAKRLYPAFPGYAFVGVSGSDEDWHRIRAVDEVMAILTNAGRPLALGEDEMARVRAHLDGLTHKLVDADVWRKDDRARVSEGPFQGFEGTVERGERRGSVSLLLSLFGRQTATEVAVERLERAA